MSINKINLLEKNVAAVVVTFNPSENVLSNLIEISKQFSKVYVVDNASSPDSYIFQLKNFINEIESVELVSLDSNLGIGYALNVGCECARNSGFNFAVTFDQDSLPGDKYLSSMVKSYNDFRNNVVLLGGNLINRHAIDERVCYVKLKKFSFERVFCDNDRDDISIVITSGTLTDLNFLLDTGGYKSEYFIDYVDTELSLRAIVNNERLGLSCKSILYHELGDKKVKKRLFIKTVPTNHSAFRRYYIARNSIFMYKAYGLKIPLWSIYDLVSTVYNAYRILFFESNVLLKVKYCSKGYLHGLLNIKGKLK